jgi:hypothetical protein
MLYKIRWNGEAGEEEILPVNILSTAIKPTIVSKSKYVKYKTPIRQYKNRLIIFMLCAGI